MFINLGDENLGKQKTAAFGLRFRRGGELLLTGSLPRRNRRGKVPEIEAAIHLLKYKLTIKRIKAQALSVYHCNEEAGDERCADHSRDIRAHRMHQQVVGGIGLLAFHLAYACGHRNRRNSR